MEPGKPAPVPPSQDDNKSVGGSTDNPPPSAAQAPQPRGAISQEPVSPVEIKIAASQPTKTQPDISGSIHFGDSTDDPPPSADQAPQPSGATPQEPVSPVEIKIAAPQPTETQPDISGSIEFLGPCQLAHQSQTNLKMYQSVMPQPEAPSQPSEPPQATGTAHGEKASGKKQQSQPSRQAGSRREKKKWVPLDLTGLTGSVPPPPAGSQSATSPPLGQYMLYIPALNELYPRASAEVREENGVHKFIVRVFVFPKNKSHAYKRVFSNLLAPWRGRDKKFTKRRLFLKMTAAELAYVMQTDSELIVGIHTVVNHDLIKVEERAPPLGPNARQGNGNNSRRPKREKLESHLVKTITQLVFVASKEKTEAIWKQLSSLIPVANADELKAPMANAIHELTHSAHTPDTSKILLAKNDQLIAAQNAMLQSYMVLNLCRTMDSQAHHLTETSSEDLANYYKKYFWHYRQCSLSNPISRPWDDPLCVHRRSDEKVKAPPEIYREGKSCIGKRENSFVYFSDSDTMHFLKGISFESKSTPLAPGQGEAASTGANVSPVSLLFSYSNQGAGPEIHFRFPYRAIEFYKWTYIAHKNSLTVYLYREMRYIHFIYYEKGHLDELKVSFTQWLGPSYGRPLDLTKGRIFKALNPEPREPKQAPPPTSAENGQQAPGAQNDALKKKKQDDFKKMLDGLISAAGETTMQWPEYGTTKDRFSLPPRAARNGQPQEGGAPSNASSSASASNAGGRRKLSFREVSHNRVCALVVIDVKRTMRQMLTRLAHMHIEVAEVPDSTNEEKKVRKSDFETLSPNYTQTLEYLRKFYKAAPTSWMIESRSKPRTPSAAANAPANASASASTSSSPSTSEAATGEVRENNKAHYEWLYQILKTPI